MESARSMRSTRASRKTNTSETTCRFTSTSMETMPGGQGLPTRPVGPASSPNYYSLAEVIEQTRNEMQMSLANKVAIVTGGNSGIGEAVVLELAKQGASIVIDYVSHPDAANAVEKQITALGAGVLGVQADVSKLEDLERLFASAVERFGRVDVMVNNAGIETRP